MYTFAQNMTYGNTIPIFDTLVALITFANPSAKSHKSPQFWCRPGFFSRRTAFVYAVVVGSVMYVC